MMIKLVLDKLLAKQTADGGSSSSSGVAHGCGRGAVGRPSGGTEMKQLTDAVEEAMMANVESVRQRMPNGRHSDGKEGTSDERRCV